MKFFQQNSRDEYNKQLRRHQAEEEEFEEEHKEQRGVAERRRREWAKEGGRERQRKHRQKTYDEEIANGDRSPGGSKQKQKVSDSLTLDL